jgi:hypothetical protein
MSPLHRPTRPTALLRALLTLLLLVATSARPAAAQGGTVEGVALRAEDGTPIPFALVRLVRGEPGTAASAPVAQQAITNANGRFHLADVPPGEYRLQLARIGFRPILSPPLRVEAGRTLQHELRGATQVLQLAAVTVRPELTCLTIDQLPGDARLASLWSEAQKGMEVRRAFELQYRFARVLRQDIETQWRLRRNSHRVEIDTIVSEPDSVLARDRRQRDSLQARGYANGNRIVLPDEKYLLDASFLRDHCLETRAEEADGAVALRFRPTGRRRQGVDIRGVIWISADTYQMRRVEFEYLDGTTAYARSWLDYRDVSIGGSPIRLRAEGGGSVEARGPLNAIVKGATAKLTISHVDVRPVRTM